MLRRGSRTHVYHIKPCLCTVGYSWKSISAPGICGSLISIAIQVWESVWMDACDLGFKWSSLVTGGEFESDNVYAGTHGHTKTTNMYEEEKKKKVPPTSCVIPSRDRDHTARRFCFQGVCTSGFQRCSTSVTLGVHTKHLLLVVFYCDLLYFPTIHTEHFQEGWCS